MRIHKEIKMRTIILYGSTTGNTEAVAMTMARWVKKHHGTIIPVQNIREYKPNQETHIFLGCSTWGEEEPCLQEDMETALEALPILNKTIALFGCGDLYYPSFCGALDILQEKLKGTNTILQPLCKLGDPWEDDKEKLHAWLAQMAQTMLQQIITSS